MINLNLDYNKNCFILTYKIKNKLNLENKILITPNYLQVYCVVSKLGSLELYNVLLDKLAELHAVSEAAVHGFLSATVSIGF